MYQVNIQASSINWKIQHLTRLWFLLIEVKCGPWKKGADDWHYLIKGLLPYNLLTHQSSHPSMKYPLFISRINIHNWWKGKKKKKAKKGKMETTHTQLPPNFCVGTVLYQQEYAADIGIIMIIIHVKRIYDKPSLQHCIWGIWWWRILLRKLVSYHSL